MKATEESQEPLWPSAEQIKRLRKKLHDRIAHEELESSGRLEALDRLLILLQIEPTAFHRLWVEPLRDAGADPEDPIAGLSSLLQSAFPLEYPPTAAGAGGHLTHPLHCGGVVPRPLGVQLLPLVPEPPPPALEPPPLPANRQL